jgi:valyl-tRNA synthetase
MNISPAEELTVLVNPKSENADAHFNRSLPYIRRLARISVKEFQAGLSKPKMAATVLIPWAEIYVLLNEDQIKKDIERLKKTVVKIERDLEPVEKKFNDNSFVTKAPRDVVAKLEMQRAELQEKRSKINAEIKRNQEMLS